MRLMERLFGRHHFDFLAADCISRWQLLELGHAAQFWRGDPLRAAAGNGEESERGNSQEGDDAVHGMGGLVGV